MVHPPVGRLFASLPTLSVGKRGCQGGSRQHLNSQIAGTRKSKAAAGGARRPRFLVFLRYQCYYGYPPLTYLEYPILIAQDVILLLCIFHFNGNVKQATPYVAVLGSSWFVLALQKWIIDLAMNFCTFISAASKFAQLHCLWKTRDSGAVSALTWSLSSYTCATRIITTLMTTNDFTILIRFVIMLALNIWVTVTVLRYRKTAMKAE
ncbi:solute carrier family 66 member 3 isoform X1 [Cebus imitator]|uniref:solute carrier family 66 member 3 isoform X1 n=1 Tax=Cebus imitator TaxID=2715852 RepID=UPI0018985357|nr:solute carrier family 66 member 3 isoform X1 [Cebus imitator]